MLLRAPGWRAELERNGRVMFGFATPSRNGRVAVIAEEHPGRLLSMVRIEPIDSVRLYSLERRVGTGAYHTYEGWSARAQMPQAYLQRFHEALHGDPDAAWHALRDAAIGGHGIAPGEFEKIDFSSRDYEAMVIRPYAHILRV